MSRRLLKDGEILTESTKYVCVYIYIGFPGGTNGKEPTCQWRRHKRHGFDLWVRKIPWRRLPGEYSSVLVWWSSWTEEPGRLQSTGSPRVRHHWSYLAHIYIYICMYMASLVAQTIKNLPVMQDWSSIPGSGRTPGRGHGNPLQYSCLGNSTDRGA